MLKASFQNQPVAERDRLREIINKLSFKEGEFTLSSGRKSNIFFNLKPTMLDPEGLNLLINQVIKEIKNVDAEYIGGLAMGAVPVMLPVVFQSYGTNRPLKGFWVRKEQKSHGMQQLVDGAPKPESNVIIVDDVTTTGNSILKAIKALESTGCKIACILTIVDRCEGAKEYLEKKGYNLKYIFNRYDFTTKSPDEF